MLCTAVMCVVGAVGVAWVCCGCGMGVVALTVHHCCGHYRRTPVPEPHTGVGPHCDQVLLCWSEVHQRGSQGLGRDIQGQHVGATLNGVLQLVEEKDTIGVGRGGPGEVDGATTNGKNVEVEGSTWD